MVEIGQAKPSFLDYLADSQNVRDKIAFYGMRVTEGRENHGEDSQNQ